MMHRILPLAPALAVLLAAPGTAATQVGTVVYVRDGNVWLSDGTGATRRPLTTGGGYRSPSLADDGIVGVLRDVGKQVHFVRLGPTGGVLSDFVDSPPLRTILQARLSPDGRLFAFRFMGECQVTGTAILNQNSYASYARICTRMAVTSSDRWSELEGANDSYDEYVTWAGRTLIVAGSSSGALQARTLDGDSRELFQEPERHIGMAELSRDGTVLLVVHRLERADGNGDDASGPWQVAVYRQTRRGQAGVVSTLPVSGIPSGAALSPDGRVWALADAAGLRIGPVGGRETVLLDPQGKEPHWGAYGAMGGGTRTSAAASTAVGLASPSNGNAAELAAPVPTAVPLAGKANAPPAAPPSAPNAEVSTATPTPVAGPAAPSYAGALAYPPKGKYKSHGRIKQTYDKFSDTTIVTGTVSYKPGLLQLLFKTSARIDLQAVFAGQAPAQPLGAVSMVVVLADLRSQDQLAGDTLKPPAAAAPDKLAIVVDDSVRLSVDMSPLGKKVAPLAESSGVYWLQDGFRAQLPLGTLLRLAGAQRRIDVRLHKVEFKLSGDELEVLRDFASRLAPAGATLGSAGKP